MFGNALPRITRSTSVLKPPFPRNPATTCVKLVERIRSSAVTVARDRFLLAYTRGGHIMGMAVPVYYSAEMVRRLPDDGKRYETVHGELLVTPAPSWWHQRILLRLARALADHVERCALGEVVISPADISWGPAIRWFSQTCLWQASMKREPAIEAK